MLLFPTIHISTWCFILIIVNVCNYSFFSKKKSRYLIVMSSFKFHYLFATMLLDTFIWKIYIHMCRLFSANILSFQEKKLRQNFKTSQDINIKIFSISFQFIVFDPLLDHHILEKESYCNFPVSRKQKNPSSSLFFFFFLWSKRNHRR